MSFVCHSCAGELDEVRVECGGFCKAVFHPRCCGVAVGLLEEALKHRQLFWLCPSCSTLMKDMRLRNTARAAYETGQEHAFNSQSNTIQNLKAVMMDELKTEIRNNFAKLINSSSCTPKSTRRIVINPMVNKSRRLFSTASDKISKQPTLLGTGSTPSPSVEIAVVPPAQPKFWLYVSRIARDVSADQLSAYAKKRLGTDDIQVVRLVARNRDINTLTFISFKIGMNMDLKTKALLTSTWPRGVVFREFSDNRSGGNFWRPEPLTVADDPLSRSIEEVFME